MSKIVLVLDDKEEIDLSEAEEVSYSAILRQLHKKYPDKINEFMKTYLQCFEHCKYSGIEEYEKIALKQTLLSLNKKYQLKLPKAFKKLAQTMELDGSEKIGKYLANIVHFILQRISDKNRPMAKAKLKRKFLNLNIREIANKKMPASSAMGQSITFVKHVLFNHNEEYVRKVLYSLVKYL